MFLVMEELRSHLGAGVLVVAARGRGGALLGSALGTGEMQVFLAQAVVAAGGVEDVGLELGADQFVSGQRHHGSFIHMRSNTHSNSQRAAHVEMLGHSESECVLPEQRMRVDGVVR